METAPSGIPVDYRRSMDIFNPIDVCKKQVTHRNTEAWEHLRYSPYAVAMEVLSKIAFLGMVFYVAIYKMGETTSRLMTKTTIPSRGSGTIRARCAAGSHHPSRDRRVFEYRRYARRARPRPETRSVRMAMALYDHFLKGVWNMLDLLGIICVFMWAILKFNEMAAVEARAFLSVAAIPMSLGILRYASVDRDMATSYHVISTSKDVYSSSSCWWWPCSASSPP